MMSICEVGHPQFWLLYESRQEVSLGQWSVLAYGKYLYCPCKRADIIASKVSLGHKVKLQFNGGIHMYIREASVPWRVSFEDVIIDYYYDMLFASSVYRSGEQDSDIHAAATDDFSEIGRGSVCVRETRQDDVHSPREGHEDE